MDRDSSDEEDDGHHLIHQNDTKPISPNRHKSSLDIEDLDSRAPRSRHHPMVKLKRGHLFAAFFVLSVVVVLCDKPVDADLILISFRGTEPFDADDWCTDFDYSWYEIPELGKVHMGFLEALGLGNRANKGSFYNFLHLNDKTRVGKQAQASKINAFPGTSNTVLEPKMVERSAYFEEGLEMMQRLLVVYTFGQPRVGDKQMHRFMESHLNYPVPKYFRVVYCNDLVPRIPHDNKTFLYKHFGVCLYNNSLYNEKKVDEEPNRNYFGPRFLIPSYLNAFWEPIRGLIMGYTHGPDYNEGWFSILLRTVG